MKKRHLSSLALLLGLSSTLLNASEPIIDETMKPEDAAIYQELMSLLNKQTEIVTKTKVNADYVPGSYTVLRAGELKRYGIRTVKDALNMSPNIEVQLNHLGQSVLVTRGLGTPFSGGTMKLMLNDVNMVSSSAGFSESILNMPVEQIDRIEIIRGAASVLHGDFAYSGVVNVVTSQENHFAVAAGSSAYAHTSASQTLKSASEQTVLSLNFAQWQSDKTGVKASGDVLTEVDPLLGAAGTLASKSQAPGEINDRRNYRSLLLGFKHNQTQVYLQSQEYKTGDYFGIVEFLPDETQDYNQTYQDLALGLRKSQKLDGNWDSEWHLGAQQRIYDLQTLYTSADIPAFQGGAYDEFAYVRPHQNYIKEQVVNLSGHLVYQPSMSSRWLLGADLERHHIEDAYIKDDVNNDPGDRLGTKNDARNVLALFAQNEWKPIENFTLTMGLRAQKTDIDYYDISQEGVSQPFEKLEEWFFTPKVAMVYHPTDKHIFKAQYSQSMITPPIHQIVNVGNNPDNKPYTSQTDHAELGYIFQGQSHVQRLTGFYSDFKNVPQGTVYYNYFSNSGFQGFEPLNKITTRGLEWDSEFSLDSMWSGFASAAWVDARDVDNDQPLVGSTNRMAKLGLSFTPSAYWRLSVWSQYTGERYREPYDSRDKLPAYILGHMTLGYNGLAKGMNFSVSVENLADTEYQNPSPINGTLTSLASGTGTAAYMDDYPGVGRQVWAKLNYEF